LILALMEIDMTDTLHPVQAAFLTRLQETNAVLRPSLIPQAPFVTKAGFEVLEPVYTAPKSAYRIVKASCSRCGGQGGAEAWKRTGFTCYKCHGDGGHRLVRETVYDREAFAKREAKQQAKVAAKRAADQAKADATKAAFEAAHGDLIAKVSQITKPSAFLCDVIEKGNKYGSISEAQASAAHRAADNEITRQAQNETAQWIGAVGDRIEITGTIISRIAFGSVFGLVVISIIKDAAGNFFVQKGRGIGDKGEEVTVKATVKGHDTYNGVKQTIITRPKVI